MLSSTGQASAAHRHLPGSSSPLWRALSKWLKTALSNSGLLEAALHNSEQLPGSPPCPPGLGWVCAVLGCRGCLVLPVGHPGVHHAGQGLFSQPKPRGVCSRGKTAAQADVAGESVLQELVAVRLVGQTTPLWALGREGSALCLGDTGALTDLGRDEGGGLSPQTSAASRTPTHVPVCLGL